MGKGYSGISGGSAERARRLDEKADKLEREFNIEMSSVETNHSVGWRENMLKQIAELRNESRQLRFGTKI